MNKNKHTKQPDLVKKAFRKPRLKNLGSVKQLTLKIGSISDGMGPHQ